MAELNLKKFLIFKEIEEKDMFFLLLKLNTAVVGLPNLALVFFELYLISVQAQI